MAEEIRHERNIILQCVRYVVENHFFEDASSKDPVSASTSPVTEITDNTNNWKNDDEEIKI